ncbi:MAG: ABC transporter substrate-binding protein [Candidatus Velthaea sp.]
MSDVAPTRRRFVTGIAAGAAAIAAPLAFPNVVRAQAETIKIGFPVPLTGPFGPEAQDEMLAAKIAIAEFNEAGGLKGRMAELLVRDDKLNAGEAASRTQELIEKDKVNFLVGGLSAAVTLAINNVAKERKILYNSISQSDAINEAKDFSPYTFHEAMNPHMTAGAVARYAFPKFGKKVVFLTADYAYGQEMVRGFTVAGNKLGINVLGDIRHPLGTTDFSSYFPRIAGLKPDVLVLASFGADIMNAIKAANDFGIKKTTRIVVPQLLYSGRMTAGAQAYEGVVGGTCYYWGIESSVPSAKRFNDKFRAANNGIEPADYAGYGYSGVKTVLTAVKNAGTTDNEKVIPALASLKYDFYKGPQHFRGCDHQSVGNVILIESRNENDMRNKYDIFKVVGVDRTDDSKLRSCEELGLKK